MCQRLVFNLEFKNHVNKLKSQQKEKKMKTELILHKNNKQIDGRTGKY